MYSFHLNKNNPLYMIFNRFICFWLNNNDFMMVVILIGCCLLSVFYKSQTVDVVQLNIFSCLIFIMN